MSKFCGFKSRWRIRWSWQTAIPRNNWNIKDYSSVGYLQIINNELTLMVAISSSPPIASMNFLRSESRYSKTNVSFFSTWWSNTRWKLLFISDKQIEPVCNTSHSRTMFGCFSSFNKAISRIAVHGTPYADPNSIMITAHASISFTSSSLSKRIRFKATISPVCRFCALYTIP